MANDQKSSAPAEKESKVLVEALKNEDGHEWVHQGRTMQPGDRTEVSLDQAVRLEKAKIARVVR
jgi:hypothetical protein